MSLNVDTPTLVGMQWFPTRQRGLPIDANRRQAAVLSPGAIATDDLVVGLRNVVGNPVVTAEVLKVSDITAANAVTTTTTYRPSADSGFGGAAHAGGGTGAPFYVDVDETVLDTADYVTNGSTTNQVWGTLFASGGFAAGRRILNVTLHFVCATTSGTTTLNPWWYTGAAYKYSAGLTATTTQTQFDVAWLTNPNSGAPWTQADVVAMASTAPLGFDLFASGLNTFRLYQQWLTVDWVTETRLASGSAIATADGSLTIATAKPDGTDTWTPDAATAYAVILSTTTPGASCAWEALDSGAAHPDVSSAPVTVTGGYPSGLGDTDTAAPAIVGVDGAGNGLWGQPYTAIVEEPIYTGRTVQQEVTLPGTQNRGWLRFVARPESTLTSVSLIARIKRRSDNVQIGGDITVTPHDVRDEPSLAQLISLPAASAGAGTAAQYYVEWSCTAASGRGWLLTTLSVDSAALAIVSIGGTTDVATIAGVDTSTRDVPVLIGQAVTSPAGLTVVAA